MTTKKRSVYGVMTPQHRLWQQFCKRLEGPQGCNFKMPGDVNTATWRCGGGMDKTYAKKILKAMGLSDVNIKRSLEYFEAHGGHCDCEILFNVVDRTP